MKIVRPDGSIVEGSPDELVQYEALSRLHESLGGVLPADASISVTPLADWEFVSADVAFRALTRIKLGKETKAIIRLLYGAGEAWTSAEVLQKAIGYKPSQFAGLMGAFGRRIVNTAGYVLNSSFFEQEWDAERSCYLYRLPPSARAAVEKARLVEA